MNKELSRRYERSLKELVEKWSEKAEVQGLVVYGSFLTSKMGRYSDLDLFIVKVGSDDMDSRVYLDGDELFNISVIGVEEFRRRLNASCLGELRMMLARYKVLFDREGELQKMLEQAAPCTNEEHDKYAITLLFHFLLELGRAENFFDLGETLDALHHSFHACEHDLRLALLDEELPFDTDVFHAGLSVKPELVTAIQDVMGDSSYDLALVSGFIDRLREEREELLGQYADNVLKYMPTDTAALSELKKQDVFSETGYILFQAYVEYGKLERVGVEKSVPGFHDMVAEEVGFRKK
ncbi:MAG: nucleotidyltransferase domain-containing protein [Planctomycetota bacterium]|nr:nucleotidyltransferase domain-containing protein [Planctomycetota bacterium]